MTKAKWVHKLTFYNSDDYIGISCGINTASWERKWAKVTCPKCLAKKSTSKKKKQEETHLYFEMDGKVSIVEKKEDGTIVSQEQIDNYVVLKCLVSLLEQGMRYEENRTK